MALAMNNQGSIVSSRRAVLAALAGASAAATFGPAWGKAQEAGNSFQSLRKAMWVWKLDTAQLTALADFAKAEAVDTAFLSLPQKFRESLAGGDQAAVSQVRALRESGLKLLALTGDPSWVESPGSLPREAARVLAAVKANRELLDGISLDVEPNALHGWHDPDHRPKLMTATVAFYAAMREAAGEIPIDAALNAGFAELMLPEGKGFFPEICRHLTSVSLMAYRDSPERTMVRAAPAIAVIEAAGLPWRLGILVHETHERGTSFVGAPRAAFEADMVRLDRMVRERSPNAHYLGLVFEDYNGLRRILGT